MYILENPWSQGESLSVVKAKANRIQYCESCFQLRVLNIELKNLSPRNFAHDPTTFASENTYIIHLNHFVQVPHRLI